MSEPEVYSGEYWRTRSPDQLKELADGSFPGGKAFDGAIAEIERRNAATERAAAQRKADEQLRWAKLTFWTAGILGAGGIAATIIAALIQKG